MSDIKKFTVNNVDTSIAMASGSNAGFMSSEQYTFIEGIRGTGDGQGGIDASIIKYDNKTTGMDPVFDASTMESVGWTSGQQVTVDTAIDVLAKKQADLETELSGLIFDVSEANGGQPFATLSDALTYADSVLQAGQKKGGMTIKYVQSSDNKYVQYLYKLEYEDTTVGNNNFVNPDNWEKINLEEEVIELHKEIDGLNDREESVTASLSQTGVRLKTDGSIITGFSAPSIVNTYLISEGEIYKISGFVATTQDSCLYVFLDANENVVSYGETAKAASVSYNDIEVVAPSGAVTVKVSGNTLYNNAFLKHYFPAFVGIKDRVTKLENETDGIRPTIGLGNGTEYYSPSAFTSNRFLSPGGGVFETQNNSMGVMHIQVKKGDTIIAKIASSPSIATIGFSVSNNATTYLIGCAYNNYYDDSTSPKTYSYDVEDDGYVIVCTTDIDNVNSSIKVYSSIKFSSVVTNMEKNTTITDAEIDQKFVRGKNLFDPSRLIPGNNYIDSSGKVVPDTGGSRIIYDYIKIEGNSTYTLSSLYGALSLYFYDRDKSYLYKDDIPNWSGTYTFTTLAEVYYVRFLATSAPMAQMMLEKNVEKTEYEPFSYKLPHLNVPGVYENIQHRILIIGLTGNVNTNRVEEDLFKCGFMCEVCSFETFVSNHYDLVDDYDVLLVSTMNIPYESELGPSDVYNSLYPHKNKKIIFFGNPYAYSAYNLGFKKIAYNGKPMSPSISANYASIIPFFNENLTIDYSLISDPNLTVENNEDYDLVHPGLSIIGGNQGLISFSGGSSDVVFPAKIENENNTLYPAFIKDNIAVIFYAGLSYSNLGGNAEYSAGWRYIDYSKLLLFMFGKQYRDRLSMDSAFGKRMVGVGVDGDLTNDLEASINLINSVADKYVLEFGFKTVALTTLLADKYRYMKSKYPKLEYASHTYSHYNFDSLSVQVTHEEHTIDTKGFVVLDCNSMVRVSAVTDEQNNSYTIISNTGVESATPTVTECVVPENEYHYNSDGRIKFNLENSGQVVFVDYTYLDDTKEAYGSIKDLEDKNLVTNKAVYLTMGKYSVNGVTYQMCDEEDIPLCEYTQFPSFRDAFIAQQVNKPIPPVLGVTMAGNGTFGASMTDANITRRDGPTTFQDTEMPNCVNYCKAMELPYVSYFHDFIISTTAANGVWLDDTRISYRQNTAEETVAFLQENLYRFMFDYINEHDDVRFMTRGDVVRMYHNLNKYIHYDIIRDSGKLYIFIRSNAPYCIEGVTFKFPFPPYAENSFYVISNNKKSIKMRWDEQKSEMVLWVDIAPGINEPIIISYSDK